MEHSPQDAALITLKETIYPRVNQWKKRFFFYLLLSYILDKYTNNFNQFQNRLWFSLLKGFFGIIEEIRIYCLQR